MNQTTAAKTPLLFWARRLASLAVVLATVSVGTNAARGQTTQTLFPWVETWGASPQMPLDPVYTALGVSQTPTTLNSQTFRQVVRTSAPGTALRLRLTNEYTSAPTAIGAVHVALAAATDKATGAIVPGSDQVVTFGGAGAITLAPNAPALSDPIDMPVGPLTSLSISIYVTSGSAPTTPHSLGQQTAYIASGDMTSVTDITAGATTTTARYLISGVDAYVRQGGATLVTLGDSITDGYASTVDQDHRWPDFLSERLQARHALRNIAVADEGISGNRLISEGIGPNALSRFDRDVLSRPGLRYIILLEGINDIGLPILVGGPIVTPAELIQADEQLIARAHERGVLIYGATLTPFKGAAYYSSNGEATRAALNTWIRGSGAFDGVVDFDKATRDPSNPLQYLPAYDSGDHLHPNDAGYAAMANAVPLSLFEQ